MPRNSPIWFPASFIEPPLAHRPERRRKYRNGPSPRRRRVTPQLPDGNADGGFKGGDFPPDPLDGKCGLSNQTTSLSSNHCPWCSSGYQRTL